MRVKYGRVLLATGLKPVSLSHIDEAVAPRVTTLRTLDDVLKIRSWWQGDTPATVTIVGAGLLGTELAWAMGACSRMRVVFSTDDVVVMAVAGNNKHGHKLQLVCDKNAPMVSMLPQYLSAEVAQRVAGAGVQVLSGLGAAAVVDVGGQPHVVLAGALSARLCVYARVLSLEWTQMARRFKATMLFLPSGPCRTTSSLRVVDWRWTVARARMFV